MDGIAALASNPSNIIDRLQLLEKDNKSLRECKSTILDIRLKCVWNNTCIFTVVDQLKKASIQSEERIKQLESRLQGLAIGGTAAPAAAAAPVAAASKASDDDDGVDLFGSDSEDEDDAAAKLREQRLSEYANKKSKSTYIYC